jgi:hypothetical protein
VTFTASLDKSPIKATSGGWARDITTKSLPIATDIAAGRNRFIAPFRRQGRCVSADTENEWRNKAIAPYVAAFAEVSYCHRNSPEGFYGGTLDNQNQIIGVTFDVQHPDRRRQGMLKKSALMHFHGAGIRAAVTAFALYAYGVTGAPQAAAQSVIYAVKDDGDLMWNKHLGRDDGTFKWATDSGKRVGTGWNVKQVFGP